MELCRTPLQIICTLATALLLQLSNAQNSKQDYLNAHNSARAQVSVEPLIWDENLAAYAQNFAEKRAGNCTLIYSRGPYGENLESSRGDLSGKDAVKLWVSEKSKYDYASNSCAYGSSCSKYAQVVWKKTTRLGCARVRCNNSGTFIACHYYPPGNFVGERSYLMQSKSNVLPPQVSPTSPSGNQSKKKGSIIIGVLAIVTCLALVCFICYWSAKACFICYSFWKRCLFRGRRESNNDYTNPDTQQLIRELRARIESVDEHNGTHKVILDGKHDQELPLFSFSSIEAATEHFSDANKLGKGGFGPVYKAWNLWKEGKGVELMDPSLEETCSTSELFRYVQIALLCVQECAADRPNMSDVISMFGIDVSSLPDPRQPAFSTVARPTDVSSLPHPIPNNNGLDENTGVCSNNYVVKI